MPAARPLTAGRVVSAPRVTGSRIGLLRSLVPLLSVHDLGRIRYAPAYEVQCRHHSEVLARRGSNSSRAGDLLFVEHEPVVTISRRPGAREHLIASGSLLARNGIDVQETDRGGDITYHGPGQLVVYPILDLNLLNTGLHEYMRMLEEVVIRVCQGFGIDFGEFGGREPGATGVWVPQSAGQPRKICAMGVRLRKWITLHGLALNVTTNLSHFDMIVPCGLAGRGVTSLERELGDACPSMDEVKDAMLREFERVVGEVWSKAARVRSTCV